jgi:hypothetical protein
MKLDPNGSNDVGAVVVVILDTGGRDVDVGEGWRVTE